MGTFKDHFSGHAAQYAEHRLIYPRSFFESLASLAGAHGLAWDCGAGNGQASLGLAGFFERVVASEPSAEQLSHARPHPRVEYRQERAEASSLADASADVALAAQAVHWFDLERFYAEVRRVVRPGGLFCASTYSFPEITPDVDRVVRDWNAEVLQPFWAKELGWVHRHYVDLPFPFEEIPFPATHIDVDWSRAGFLAKIGTWSGVQRALERTGTDPRDELERRLAPLWDDRTILRARWRIWVRLGRV